MADTGWLSPTGTSTDSSVGLWSNPGNVYASDNAYATCSVSAFGPAYLVANGFNVNVPVGSTIDGVQVQVEDKASGGGISNHAFYLCTGSVTAKNKSRNAYALGSIATVDTVYTGGNTGGGATSFWGNLSNNGGSTYTVPITETIVNSSTFGVYFLYDATSVARTVSVDQIQLRVYYTAPSSGVSLVYSNTATASQSYVLKADTGLAYSNVGTGTNAYALTASGGSTASLAYSNVATGGNAYTVQAAFRLAYTNAATGSNAYALKSSAKLAYTNTSTAAQNYTPVFKATLAYLNASTSASTYALKAASTLRYLNAGLGVSSYTVSLKSGIAYNSTSFGTNAYRLSVIEASVQGGDRRDGAGSLFPEKRGFEALKGETQSAPEPVDDEIIIEQMPSPPVITVEADASLAADLIERLTPEPVSPPDLGFDLLREAFAAIQIERAQQEEEAAAMLLMQVAGRRKRSFLHR